MRPPALLLDALHVLADQAAVFGALLLFASAIHKVANWPRLLGVVRPFVGVRASLAPLLLAADTAVGLAAGGLLVVPGTRLGGALLAAALWATYLAFILRAVLMGRREMDCGCSFGGTRRPLGSYQIARNAVLITLALAVACDAHATGGGGLQASQVLAGCALLALYAAIDQVMGLQPLRSGEVA
jgi:hypothetical protein